MTKKQYLEESEELKNNIFRLADHAFQVVFMTMEKKKTLSKDDLYGDTDDPDWIWMMDDSRVLYIDWNDGCVVVGLINDNRDEDDAIERYLKEMNPLDKIEIADYLAERF